MRELIGAIIWLTCFLAIFSTTIAGAVLIFIGFMFGNTLSAALGIVLFGGAAIAAELSQ